MHPAFFDTLMDPLLSIDDDSEIIDANRGVCNSIEKTV